MLRKSHASTHGCTGLTSNIQDQEIALSLDVVPVINSDDELTLQISQQNNEQSGTITINGNPYPTISQQRLNTIEVLTFWGAAGDPGMEPVCHGAKPQAFDGDDLEISG